MISSGERYRRKRVALGLTQAQLARFLKLHPQTISDRERGDSVSHEAWLAITNPNLRGGDDG